MRRALAGVALLVACACGGALPERPNVLLVTVDTLRPDHLSCYGATQHETPNVDRLAEEGVLFENAVADSPWTTPSMASVMTGNYPTRHGFKSTNVNRLSPDNRTLAEVLGEAGWRTAAVVGSFPLDAIYQLDQGFSRYDDTFTTPVWVVPDHEQEELRSTFFESPERQRFFVLSKLVNDSRRTDAQVTDAALAWLEDAPEGPFFLWVHYFGPHEKPDWTVPAEERQKRHLDMYAPGVLENDREIGRLLDALDEHELAGDTLVVFHADHGESLGEDGLLGHGMLLNEASLRIPLLMRLPGGVAAGARVRRLVRNVDVFPTVLEAAGLPVPGDLSGESLLPLVSASPLRRWIASRAPERTAYMETYYPAHSSRAAKGKLPDGTELSVGRILRGVQSDAHRLVRTEWYPLLDMSRGSVPEVPEAVRRSQHSERFFELADGTVRAVDLARTDPEAAAELRALLDEHLAEERYREPLQTITLEEEMQLRLEALGYGERAAPGPAARGSGDSDPDRERSPERSGAP